MQFAFVGRKLLDSRRQSIRFLVAHDELAGSGLAVRVDVGVVHVLFPIDGPFGGVQLIPGRIADVVLMKSAATTQ